MDVPDQPTTAMTKVISTGRGTESGTIAIRPRLMTSSGSATTTSVNRLMTWSAQRPPSAADSPRATPMNTCTRVAMKATPSDTRAP